MRSAGILCYVLALLLMAQGGAKAQVQSEAFSYPIGLDPNGDNWVALRSLPSGSEGVRIARLGPETLFTEIRRAGPWVNVRLPSGESGWVHSRYVGCCRSIGGPAREIEPVANASCNDLWYERNAIFKAAGYCFKTQRAISTFGNAGCQHDDESDVPLSARQRDQVASIKSTERRLQCAP